MIHARPDTRPGELDLTTPSAARMYNRYIGGAHNTEHDRTVAGEVLRVFPEAEGVAWDNRDLLGRVVRDALDSGIRQFLDLGSGVPSAGAVHEIVDRHTHGSGEGRGEGRVVYVDRESTAVTAIRKLLDDNKDLRGWVGAVHADIQRPDVILTDKHVRELIDFTQPVLVCMFAVLHFVGGDTPDIADLIGRYRRMIPVGSRVAISQVANDDAPNPEAAARAAAAVQIYRDHGIPIYVRDRAQITDLFDGLTLLEPGVVHPPDWWPDTPTSPDSQPAIARRFAWCGVGEKPHRAPLLAGQHGQATTHVSAPSSARLSVPSSVASSVVSSIGDAR
jgi:S-adenosyl methyltransferase